MAKIENVTMNIKYVFGCFATIALMSAAFANLTNVDNGLADDITRIDAEVVRVDKRIDGGATDTKTLEARVAEALTDIAVIKSSQRNQELQLKEHQRNQEQNSKEQVVLLREILKLQISGK